MLAGGLLQLVANGYSDSYNNKSSSSCTYDQYKRIQKSKTKPQNPILKTKKYKNHREYDRYNQIMCPVCQNKYKCEDFICVLYCRHTYHEACKNKLLTKCPLCRQ